MKFQIAYMAFMTIIMLLIGTWSAHRVDSITDYSTINWEMTKP